MPELPCHTVVFTDLDGTLLDDAYDLDGAALMLNELRRCGVLPIPASSKTRAEMQALGERLDYATPLIGENGALLVWPDALADAGVAHSWDQHVASYEEICATLAELRDTYHFKFTGFADMSLDELCSATSLDLHAASLARQRTASEPISWADSPERLQALRAQLKQRGLTLIAGGRFLHVMSPVDKGDAAAHVLKVLTARCQQRPRVLACGDSPNDLSMLTLADGCLVFPQRDGAFLSVDGPVVFKAHAPGVLAWLKGVKTLMHSLKQPPNLEVNA